jgi:hypothetical protein
MLRFVLPLVALSSRALGGDHDVDEEEALKLPICACLAEELDFVIDCSKPDAVKTAYDAVKACTDCSAGDCYKNWAIVETHHDLCFHDEIPMEVEVGFHDLEEVCEHACLVGRKKEAGMEECPAIDCDDADTLASLDFEGCTGDDATCTAECGASYKLLRAYHDGCAEGIFKAYETLIHSVEEPCEEYNCWVDSPHCAPTNGADVSTLDVLELKERGLDKCEMTEAEAKICLHAEDHDDHDDHDDEEEEDSGDSAAFAAAFLAYFLC